MLEPSRPPAIPLAILDFFKQQPDFPALAGDISEEFHQLAQSTGAKAAKRWYWREARRTALALTWRELVRTPVRTALTTFGGLLMANILTGLCFAAVIDVLRVSPSDLFTEPSLRPMLALLDLVPLLAIGWISGKLLEGREWAAALTFTLIIACIHLIGAGFLFRRHLPPLLAGFHFAGNVIRLGVFWVGALWIRRSRWCSLDGRVEAADRE